MIAPLDAQAPSRLEMVKVDPAGVEVQLGSVPAASPSSGEGFSGVDVTDDQMGLRWAGEGVLEFAERVEGPWTPVADATSPHTVTTTLTAAFYRIRR